jgi:hypothetical protein
MEKESVLNHAIDFYYGQTSRSELSMLYDYAKDKTVLSLGNMIGLSNFLLMNVAKTFYSWDEFVNGMLEPVFGKAVHNPFLPEITPYLYNVYIKDCQELIKNNKVKLFHLDLILFDVLFLDLDKSYIELIMYEAFFSKIKEDGLIIIRGYNDIIWEEISESVNNLIKEGKLELIDNVERLGIFKKL